MAMKKLNWLQISASLDVYSFIFGTVIIKDLYHDRWKLFYLVGTLIPIHAYLVKYHITRHL